MTMTAEEEPMTPVIEGRPLTTDDMKDLLRMALHMSEESRFDRFRLNLERTKAILTRLIELPQCLTYGVEKNGELVGFILAENVQDLWHDMYICVEHILYIKPEHRGAGVSSVLLDEFKAYGAGSAMLRCDVFAGCDDTAASYALMAANLVPTGQIFTQG